MPTILIKKSDTPGAAPTGSDLTNLSGGAEIAVNTADKRVFSMNSSSAIIELGTNPGSLTTADASATVFRSGSATITNLLATSLTVSSGSTLDGGVVVNETGANVDFRVESATDANLLFADAGNDRIGIGTNTPSDKLQIVGGTALIGTSTGSAFNSNSLLRLQATTGVPAYIQIKSDNNQDCRIIFGDTDDARRGEIVFDHATDDMAFLTGNSVEAMRIDSSGNLGLGVTPSAWGSGYKSFQITPSTSLTGVADTTNLATNYYFDGSNPKYITTGNAMLYQQITGQHRWFTAASGTAGNTITFTQAMTLDASGRLGIGTTSPAAKLEIAQAVDNTDGPKLRIANNGNTLSQGQLIGGIDFFNGDDSGEGVGAYIYSYTTDSIGRAEGQDLRFATGGTTERARITSGGYFKASNNGAYYGSTSAYHELYTTENDQWTALMTNATAGSLPYGLFINYSTASPNGTSNHFLYCQDNAGGGTPRATIRSNGGLANYQANDANLSDERVKTDIKPVGSYWDKFKAIEIVTFKYKDQTHDDDNIGVIAQQVEAVAPEFVDVDGFGETPEDGVPFKTIYTTDMYHAAIKALQEAMTRIEALEAEVAALKEAK